MNIEETYSISYQTTMEALERKAGRSSFDKNEIENELAALYNYEGLGWTGRGMVKDAEISSAIAAYEAFLKRN